MLIQEEVKEIYVWEDVPFAPWANTVAYRPLNSTTQYNDLWGNGYTLSPLSTQKFLTLNGVDCLYINSNYLNRTTAPKFPIWASPITISLWFAERVSFRYWWWNQLSITKTTGAKVYCYTDSSQSTTNRLVSTTAPTTSTRYLLTITYDWTTVKMYMNGVLEDSKARTLTTTEVTSSNDLRVGTQGSYMSELFVENRCWSDSEISDYYNQTKSKYWL